MLLPNVMCPCNFFFLVIQNSSSLRSLKHLNPQPSSEGNSQEEGGDQLSESTGESSCTESTMEVSLDFLFPVEILTL